MCRATGVISGATLDKLVLLAETSYKVFYWAKTLAIGGYARLSGANLAT